MDMNRREFVKGAAGMAGMMMAGCATARKESPLFAGPSLNVRGANERIRVACVGFSDRFRYSLLPCFLDNAKELNFDIVAVADLWKKRLNEEAIPVLKEKTGHDIKGYASDEALYAEAKDVDAVIISTADFQHAQHAAHAVNAGKDAYCEKPMAEDMYSANMLLDAVNAKRDAGFALGAVLQIGSQRRSGPAYHAARDYIRSGKFGEIKYVDLCWNVNQPRRWRRDEKYVASLKEEDTDWRKWLLDRPYEKFDPRKYLEFRLFWPYSSGIPGQWMCHQIDTVSWFTGIPYPTSAVASGGLYAWNDGRQSFDTFTTILEYGHPGKGFQAVFSSRQTNCERGNVEKYYSTTGTIDLIAGTASNDGVERWGMVDGKWGETSPRWEKKLTELASGGAAATAANTGADPLTNAHMRNWMECVRARKNPNASIEAGYGHAVALIMANAACRTGMKATFDAAARQVMAGGKVWTGYASTRA